MAYIGASPTTSAFVTDTFNGNGSTVAFTMSVAPANTTSIIVAVSGVLQDPSTYSVSGTTLTFSAAPPAGTGNISVRFLGIPASGVVNTAYRTVTEFTATAGQTSFSVPSYTAGYINVYRNGALLGTSDYTATSGTTVVLANPASSGDLVVTESFYVSSVLNAIPAVANAVTDSYINSGAVTQSKLGTGVAGNGPAFSAYQSASQTPAANVFTKLTINTEEFDTANCYDSSTNYRFTPNVAGYYQVSGCFNLSGASVVVAAIFKNGSAYKWGGNSTGATLYGSSVSCLVYLNGSTDYVEFYAYTNNGVSFTVTNSATNTWFQAAMVRAA